MTSIAVIFGDRFTTRPTPLWAGSPTRGLAIFFSLLHRKFEEVVKLSNRDEFTGMDGFTIFVFRYGLLTMERSFCFYSDLSEPPARSGSIRQNGIMVQDDEWSLLPDAL